MLTLIHNPNCSKSRAVLKILENSKQPFSIVEYLNEPISFQTLDKILRLLNMQPQEIVRRSEDEFESIRNEIPATGSVDERKRWIELLIRYPVLIERPIVFTEHSAVIGRPPEKVAEWLEK